MLSTRNQRKPSSTRLGDTPPPETFEDMLALLSTNDDLRGEMVKVMTEQTGIPAFMADMLLKNADFPDGRDARGYGHDGRLVCR